MATGAPAGCDASESDCSPKMCSIGHPNVLAQMKLQQAPKATPKEPKSCAGSYEGPTSSCHKCNGFISCRCTGIYCPKCNHQMYNTSLSQWDQEAREEYDWIVHKHSIDCDICQHLTTINAQGAYKCSGGCYIHINRSKYVHFDTST